MSSGVTPMLSPPIVIAGLVEIGVVMPIRWASAAIRVRADLEADFGEDRVVGERRRAGQRVRARVGAFVVVDDELFVPSVSGT